MNVKTAKALIANSPHSTMYLKRSNRSKALPMKVMASYSLIYSSAQKMPKTSLLPVSMKQWEVATQQPSSLPRTLLPLRLQTFVKREQKRVGKWTPSLMRLHFLLGPLKLKPFDCLEGNNALNKISGQTRPLIFYRPS
jgi:hypothetical protein